jgi:hypothetical protein
MAILVIKTDFECSKKTRIWNFSDNQDIARTRRVPIFMRYKPILRNGGDMLVTASLRKASKGDHMRS